MSELLGWPLETLTYKRVKVIQNRPQLSDVSEQLRADLRAANTKDRLVYGRVAQIAAKMGTMVDSFEEKVERFKAKQARIDQHCTGETHNFFIGHDCYNMTKP